MAGKVHATFQLTVPDTGGGQSIVVRDPGTANPTAAKRPASGRAGTVHAGQKGGVS